MFKIFHKLKQKNKIKKINRRYAHMSVQEMFEYIYRNNVWGNKKTVNRDFYSGPGSNLPRNSEYISTLVDIIDNQKIRHVADVGCGDFRVGSLLIDALNAKQLTTTYTGLDVVKPLIERNIKEFTSLKNVSFKWHNAVESAVQGYDLVIIREVLQHLNNEQAVMVLKNIAPYCKLMIITESISKTDKFVPNLDKPTNGPLTRATIGSGIDVSMPPFEYKATTLLREERSDSVLHTVLVKN